MIRVKKINSGSCKISIWSWMYDLSIYCSCLILVLTRVTCSINILLKRRKDFVGLFVLWFAQRCVAN